MIDTIFVVLFLVMWFLAWTTYKENQRLRTHRDEADKTVNFQRRIMEYSRLIYHDNPEKSRRIILDYCTMDEQMFRENYPEIG